MMNKIKSDMEFLVRKIMSPETKYKDIEKLQKQVDLLQRQHFLMKECRKITKHCK